MKDTRHNSGRDGDDDDRLDDDKRAKIEAIHEQARREAAERRTQQEAKQSKKRETDAEASANPDSHRDRPPHDS